MTQFGGSLRFVELHAVAELLATLGSTGRLQVTHRQWDGEILLRRGQIVAARLGSETGRSALEGIAIGLLDGDLKFGDDAIGDDLEVLISAGERQAYLQGLHAERQQVIQLVPALALVNWTSVGS